MEQADTSELMIRRLAVAGGAGVGGFVLAWAVQGARRTGYSAVDDAISRLAEVGTPGRSWMTAGFTAFGIGVPVYAASLRSVVDGPAWISAVATGVATLGVAAAPLGRADTAHYVFATVGYVTLAATPLLAARDFDRRGAHRWARISRGCGLASGTVLALSMLDPFHGLSQRVGLGITDAWIIGTAWSIWRHGRAAFSSDAPT